MDLVDDLTVMFVIAFGCLQVLLIGIMVIGVKRSQPPQREPVPVIVTRDVMTRG